MMISAAAASASASVSGQSLHQLVSEVRRLEATDHRDHVYGVLGMYRISRGVEVLPSLLTPDYSKSVAQVLIGATLCMILETRTLDILDDLSDSDLDLPSWCPDWAPIRLRYNGYPLAPFFKADNGSKIRKVVFFYDSSLRTISLVGIIVDRIQSFTNVLSQQRQSQDDQFPQLLDTVEEMVKGAGSMDEQALNEVIGATLIAGQNIDMTPADYESQQDYLCYTSALRGNLKPFWSDLLSGKELARMIRYKRALRRGCHQRRFFVTRGGGYFGLGSARLQEDDLIVILYGCRTPCVLRPAEGAYRIVGTCYVYGIMFGEAVRKHEAEGKEDVTFRIV